MSTPQQSTQLVRSGTPVTLAPVAIAPPAFANRGSFPLDPRPYLVTIKDRKTAPRGVQRYPGLFPHEPEDARMTGTTRSLYRRLLALNLPGPISPSATSASAGEVAKSLSAGFKIA